MLPDRLDHLGVLAEARRALDRQGGPAGAAGCDERGQVAQHVAARAEEQRAHQHPGGALRGQRRERGTEVGLHEFEEGQLDRRAGARRAQPVAHRMKRLRPGLGAGAVGEEEDGLHIVDT